MDTQDLRKRLIDLLREKSVRTGTFTLASGRTSDFYVDVRQTALHAEGSYLIGSLVIDALADDVTAVGGMTLGADPVASAAAALSTVHGRPTHGFIIRKEPKGHGTGAYLVGDSNLPAGTRVCMVEDTTTTGGSLITAIKRAEAAGLVVAQCLTIVDREEGATAALAAAGYTLQALTNRTELLS
jgi:orotate phosphoribosyltransferase